MQSRQILYLAVLSVLTVFSVVAGWEFVVEDMVEGHWAIGGDGKTLYERWELVITATCATVVFWAVSSPVLLRILAQRDRAERDRAERRLREAFETLDQKVEDRTAELEYEIAERTRAEHGLRRLASIIETSADAITAMTLGGIITDWNSAAADMYGFTADEAIGEHVSIITPPDRTEEVRMFIEETSRGNILKQIETVRRRKDGTRLEISVSVAPVEDEAGNVVGLTAIHRDITDRKRATEAIRESHDRISGILDLAQEAVISIDDDQRIRLFNQSAEAIFGYGAEEILGHSLEILIPERFRGAHPGQISDFAKAPGASRHMNERDGIVGVRKDGTDFCAEASISKLERDGKTSFTVMLRDVTERKQIELEQVQAYEHLLEAQIVIEEQAEDLMKLAEESDQARRDAESASRAKSDFLASMSHEIRTPMNGVIGMAGILLDSELSVEQREQTRTIKESADALLMLLNDILDLSKIEAGQVELELLNFDLGSLLDSVAALWESHFRGKGLTFSIESDPEMVGVLKSDPTRIRQMLFNLIGNAVKFTDQGSVTLAVSQRQLTDDEIELRFTVTDTGIGISSEAQSRLFTKFSQADVSVTRKYGGTGLGLAICKELAGLLGGEIGLESAPGQGSTFWFTVRCAPGDVEAVTAEAWTEDAKTPTSV